MKSNILSNFDAILAMLASRNIAQKLNWQKNKIKTY